MLNSLTNRFGDNYRHRGGAWEGIMVVGFGLHRIDPENALSPSALFDLATAIAELPSQCLRLNLRRARALWQEAVAPRVEARGRFGETRIFVDTHFIERTK
jgi:hypothetical protein